MKNWLRSFLLCTLILSGLYSERSLATHVIGGEIYYECLNPAIGAYRFTVKLYRDCYTGVPPFDDPIYVSLYDTTGLLYAQMSMALPPFEVLENNTYNFCLFSPPDICVQEAVYTVDYILPPGTGTYYFTYQRCCRNQGILNIPNPEGTGFGFEIIVPDTNISTCNSSPYYNQYPPTIICVDAPFEYDHSATDPDGDSLVYYLCGPNDYNAGTWGIVPNPSGPPASNLDMNYLNPYDSTYPIWAPVDSFKIDPATGWMTGTPTQAGRYVVAVCVSEYRNGVLLSTNSRDFQFNVAECLDDPLLTFTTVGEPCDNLTIHFTYTGNQVASYAWDFGVDSLDSDTSDLENPSYTFPGIGIFPVTLIVNEAYYCADTLTIQVVPPQPFSADFDWELVCPGFPVDFTDSSTSNIYSGDIVQWSWDFGDGGTDTLQNPTHTYSTDDEFYYPSLTITSANGCIDTSEVDTVNFFPLPNIEASEDLYVTVGQNAQLLVSGGISYAWSPNIYLNDSSIFNPIALPPDDFNYVVVGMSPDSCLNRDTVTVFIEDPQVTIPNAFSPNGDGENDTLYLIHIGLQKLIEWKIFNRWGQLVFETADIKQGWDGMFKGEPQEIGNFAYYYKAESLFGDPVEGSGDIALIR